MATGGAAGAVHGQGPKGVMRLRKWSGVSPVPAPVCRTSAVPAKPGRRDLLSAEGEVWGRPSRGSLSPPAPTRPAPVGGSAVTLRLSLVPPWKGIQDGPFDGTRGSEF